MHSNGGLHSFEWKWVYIPLCFSSVEIRSSLFVVWLGGWVGGLMRALCQALPGVVPKVGGVVLGSKQVHSSSAALSACVTQCGKMLEVWFWLCLGVSCALQSARRQRGAGNCLAGHSMPQHAV